MSKFNVHDAKTHLSRLLQQVEDGEEVIIARAGKPVARLVRMDAVLVRERTLGGDEGEVTIAPDFDDPLPEDYLKLFEG